MAIDVMVPPVNGQPGFVVNDAHHQHQSRGYTRDNCDEFMTLADRVSTASENVMANDNANAHHASSTAERLGLASMANTDTNGAEARLVTNQNGVDVRGSVERNGAEGRGNTDRNGLEGRSVTERFGFANLEATRKEGHETREDVDKFGFRTQDAVERYGLKNLEATKDSLKDLLISTKDDLKNVLISQKDDIKDLLISNKNDFRDVLLKSCQVEKDMLLQFKDAQLVAMENKAALQAQIAECCCEQKELTRAEGSATRDLIRAENETRLRDKIAHLQQQLLRSTILPLPTAAVV